MVQQPHRVSHSRTPQLLPAQLPPVSHSPCWPGHLSETSLGTTAEQAAVPSGQPCCSIQFRSAGSGRGRAVLFPSVYGIERTSASPTRSQGSGCQKTQICAWTLHRALATVEQVSPCPAFCRCRLTVPPHRRGQYKAGTSNSSLERKQQGCTATTPPEDLDGRFSLPLALWLLRHQKQQASTARWKEKKQPALACS